MQLGDVVHYLLDATDVVEITSRRANFQLFNQGRAGYKHPHDHDVHHASGHVAHVGTPVHVGQQCAAMVSLIPDPPRVNLRVLLDGSDVQHVTSVAEGNVPGTWQERVLSLILVMSPGYLPERRPLVSFRQHRVAVFAMRPRPPQS